MYMCCVAGPSAVLCSVGAIAACAKMSAPSSLAVTGAALVACNLLVLPPRHAFERGHKPTSSHRTEQTRTLERHHARWCWKQHLCEAAAIVLSRGLSMQSSVRFFAAIGPIAGCASACAQRTAPKLLQICHGCQRALVPRPEAAQPLDRRLTVQAGVLLLIAGHRPTMCCGG